MKTFTNKKGISYLFLEVPEDAVNITLEDLPILGNTICYDRGEFLASEMQCTDIKGNYELIGLAKDATESQAAEIVDGISAGQIGRWYKDYTRKGDQFCFEDAAESLSSYTKKEELNNPIILKLIK